jgi:TRAP-type uncharacterized transport system substrate-binding protein
MAGFRGSDGGLVLLLFLLASTGCSSPQAVAPGEGALAPAVLRIGDDPFVASLATEFSRAVPQVEIRRTAVTSAGGWGAIQRNEVDLALAPANNAYFNYVEGVQNGVPAEMQLRAISALHVTPFILVVRPDADIHNVAGLGGHAIARSSVSSTRVPPPATRAAPSPTAFDATRVTDLVLDAFGVLDDVRVLNGLTVEEITAGFKSRTVDAAFGSAYFQRDIFGALTDAGGRIVPIEGPQVDALQRRFPFIRHTLVAPNTYHGQASAVRTVGVDLLLVCRSGLDANLVYELTRRYFAALPALLAVTDAVSRVDLERASASPIPLHDGAARYYRESELDR